MTTSGAARLFLLIGLGLALAGCEEGVREQDILGRWEIADPGGALVGGSVEFSKSGRVTVTEHLRIDGSVKRTVLSGTYQLTDSDRIMMQLSRAGGAPMRQQVGIGFNDGWLTLHFDRGSIAYRRPTKG